MRQTDPRIAAQVHAALGGARTVLNVGAGAGSYEPTDRRVIAIEPSAAMRAQRPRRLSPAIRGFAEDLPLDDQSVDAAMAMVTVHHWRDLKKGLAELRRVSRGPIVILTFDGSALDRFWQAEYAPELMDAERERYPPMQALADGLGGDVRIEPVPIPIDCADGFAEAFYARPERLLEPAVRAAHSGWGFVAPGAEAKFEGRLAEALASGAWDARHGHWRTTPSFEGALRLVVRP